MSKTSPALLPPFDPPRSPQSVFPAAANGATLTELTMRDFFSTPIIADPASGAERGNSNSRTVSQESETMKMMALEAQVSFAV